MQVDVLSNVSEYSDSSRPNSRTSDIPITSRKPIIPGAPNTRSRKGAFVEKRWSSYGTKSMLVDYDDDARHDHVADRSTTVIEEEEEEADNGERKK